MSLFKISVSSSALSALKSRLEGTIFPDELDGAGWDYGAPLTNIKRLVNRWRDGFDWRKEEERLNATLPQFTRDIEVEGFGILNIHYIHDKRENAGGIPLLFVHGCECRNDWRLLLSDLFSLYLGPGSFLEVSKIIHLLTKGGDSQLPVFDVVAISLPGYAFSEGPKKKGFSLAQYAEVGTISWRLNFLNTSI